MRNRIRFSAISDVLSHPMLNSNLKGAINLRVGEKVNNKEVLGLVVIPFRWPLILWYGWPELGRLYEMLMTKRIDWGEGLFLNWNCYIIKSGSISQLKEKEEQWHSPHINMLTTPKGAVCMCSLFITINTLFPSLSLTHAHICRHTWKQTLCRTPCLLVLCTEQPEMKGKFNLCV